MSLYKHETITSVPIENPTNVMCLSLNYATSLFASSIPVYLAFTSDPQNGLLFF